MFCYKNIFPVLLILLSVSFTLWGLIRVATGELGNYEIWRIICASVSFLIFASMGVLYFYKKHNSESKHKNRFK